MRLGLGLDLGLSINIGLLQQWSNKAIEFDGINDFVTFGDSDVLNYDDGFIVEAKFATEMSGVGVIVGKGDGVGDPRWIVYITGGKIVARYGDGIVDILVRSAELYNDGEAHTLKVIGDFSAADSIQIFIDGQEVTYDRRDDPTSLGSMDNTIDLIVGANGDPETLFWEGVIRDVAISSLANTQVWSVKGDGINDSNWVDQVGSVDGTVNGDPYVYKFGDLPVFETTGVFDLTSPSWFNPSKGTFIVEFTDTLDTSATNVVLSLTDGTTNNRIELVMPKYSTDGRILSIMDASGSSQISNALGGGSGANRIRVAGLHKLAIAYENGDTAFYLNGVPVGRNTSANIPVVNRVAVGSRAGGTLPFDGTIGAVKYYNTRKDDEFLRSQTVNIPKAITASYNSDLNIIMFKGQSNSSGRATSDVVLTNSGLKLIGNDGALKDYADPYDDDTSAIFEALTDSGADGSYAGKVIDDIKTSEDGVWGAMPANLGGTPVIGATVGWAFDYASSGTATGEKRTSAQAYAAYIHSLIAKRHGVLRAIVWHQGESDALATTPEASFKAATQSWLSFLNSTLDVPVIIVGLHKWYTSAGMGIETDWNNVRTWQEDIADLYTWASFADLAAVDGNASDRIHLDITGNTAAGGIVSAAVASAL